MSVCRPGNSRSRSFKAKVIQANKNLAKSASKVWQKGQLNRLSKFLGPNLNFIQKNVFENVFLNILFGNKNTKARFIFKSIFVSFNVQSEIKLKDY